MKNLLVLIMIILASCNTYNDKMNNLLESKAKLELEYKIADSMSANFTERNTIMIKGINRKYEEEQIAGVNTSSEWFRKWSKERGLILESNIFHSNTDSAEKYAKNSKILLNQLKNIEYSIDSLSKLK